MYFAHFSKKWISIFYLFTTILILFLHISIDLLLKKCVDLNKSKILFIYYSEEIKDFIQLLVNKAKQMGIKEVYLEIRMPNMRQ